MLFPYLARLVVDAYKEFDDACFNYRWAMTHDSSQRVLSVRLMKRARLKNKAIALECAYREALSVSKLSEDEIAQDLKELDDLIKPYQN